MYRLQKRNRFDLFDDWFDGFFKTSNEALLKTDIKEKENNYELSVDVPGIEKKDIQITLEKGYLCVTVNKTQEENVNEEYFIRKERMSSSASRKFYVGKELEESDISAKLENGVLVLEVPKETGRVVEKKQIEIK